MGIDFPIPGNDDVLRAIELYCDLVSSAILDLGQAEMSSLRKRHWRSWKVEVTLPPAANATEEATAEDAPKRQPPSAV